MFTRFKRFTKDIKKEIKMRKINKIIVHCTATQEGKEISVETIRGWHVTVGDGQISVIIILLV